MREPEASRETAEIAEPETPQEIAAACLASGRTRKVAAEAAGVSERQIYRWQHDPAFRRLVSQHRSRLVDECLGALSRHSKLAAHKLGKLLHNENATVALNAANAILSHAVKLSQAAELAERVSMLEAQLSENNSADWSD